MLHFEKNIFCAAGDSTANKKKLYSIFIYDKMSCDAQIILLQFNYRYMQHLIEIQMQLNSVLFPFNWLRESDRGRYIVIPLKIYKTTKMRNT